MALPTSINNATPLGSASPATIDDQFRDLKLFLTDLFGVPNATNISANVMTVVAGGLDSINFANSGANAAVAGELQRNGANLTFHDGTSARTTVWAETTQTVSGNKTFSAGVWNGTAVGSQYGGTGQNTSANTGVPSISSGTWSVASTLSTTLGGTGQNFSATAQGNTLYFSANGTMAALAPGTSGQYLKTQGASANPTWDTAVAVTGAGQLVRTNATTLTLNAFNGNRLFINGGWQTIPSTGPTLSNSGLVASTVYYIYAYMNGATLTLEASTTAYATDTTNGHRIKTGDASRSLVGLVRTEGSTPGQFVDSATQRFTRTWFNDPGINGVNHFTAERETTSATFAELNSEIRVEFVSWSGEQVFAAFSGGAEKETGGTGYYSIGFDGTTAVNTSASARGGLSGPTTASAQCWTSSLSEGYHYATQLGLSTDGNKTKTLAGVAADGQRWTLKVFARS